MDIDKGSVVCRVMSGTANNKIIASEKPPMKSDSQFAVFSHMVLMGSLTELWLTVLSRNRHQAPFLASSNAWINNGANCIAGRAEIAEMAAQAAEQEVARMTSELSWRLRHERISSISSVE